MIWIFIGGVVMIAFMIYVGYQLQKTDEFLRRMEDSKDESKYD